MDKEPTKPPQIENQENETIEKAIQGDLDAFSDLYQKYILRIYNYIYYRVGSTSEAEDLTAKVFFRAFDHIKSYRNLGLPFSAWLYRIAHNFVANWHRDNSRRQEVPLEEHEDMHAHVVPPETALLQNQEIEALLRIIRTFPPDRQQLIILKYVEDLPNNEIALIMRRSESAIKSLYHRTLVELRKALESSIPRSGE